MRKVAAVLLHETGMRQAAQIELAVAHWNLVRRQQQQQQLWHAIQAGLMGAEHSAMQRLQGSCQA
jgi:hypothetical protein